MANLNTKAESQNTFDAIVVGTGISGGWSIKELTELGLKVLALDRGRDVKHGDYPTAMLDPWQIKNNDEVPEDILDKDYWVQKRTGYTIKETTKHWWIKDSDHPYEETKRFDWIRAYHVGGRSLLWGRQSYRLSDLDFEANQKDGVGVDWPIRYKDIEKWYDYVETFAGISGQAEGLPHLPDGKFLPPMELNCAEKDFKSKLESAFPGRKLTIGRTAIVTVAHNGRGPCQYRNRCMRGCPFGAYFSSQSATLPAAYKTGNLTLRPNSVVESVIYDKVTGKAKGVRVIDSETLEVTEYFARIIFLNASAIASTAILMNSKSERFPNGMGNDSGELGHNLMDHHFKTGARAKVPGFEDQYYFGRRANGIYIPRFRNLNGNDMPFIRGYGYQGGASREGWTRDIDSVAGPTLLDEVSRPGDWYLNLTGFGECLPYHENHFKLDESKKDKFGLPTLIFDAEFKDNEMKMREDMRNSAAEMLEAAGYKNVNTYDQESYPGLGIHEMGTARMGRDPKTSVLNEWNQVHDVKNVFVTDGACMTSAGCQNPSLTYMALSARAAHFAVEEMKKGKL